MSRLDELKQHHRHRAWRLSAWLVMALLAAGIGWAAMTELDEVAVAQGEVVTRDKVKTVQHLEGGIIQELLVAEGDRVTAGEPLVVIDLPTTAINLEEVRIRLEGLLLTQARLAAESEGLALSLPAAEAERQPELAAAERRAFEARNQELRSQLQALEEQKRQRTLMIRELTATRRALRTDLGLARQNLAMSADLLKDGLTSRMEHLRVEREVKRLEGEIAALSPAIPRAEAALAEVGEKLREAELTHRRKVLDERREAELELARTRERLAEATRQDQRTVIRSPADGVVKNLRYHTIGGVVRPGEAILELVPSEESFVIEARLSPTDRGYVAPGQEARAKITSYDFVRYGALEGSIARIAPDSTTSPEGEPFYLVVMEPERAFLGEAAGELPIMPGMQATVDIKTGSKSLLSYIVEPILRIRDEAFRERL